VWLVIAGVATGGREGGMRYWWVVILAVFGGVVGVAPVFFGQNSALSLWSPAVAAAVGAAAGAIIDFVRRSGEAAEHRRSDLMNAVLDGCLTGGSGRRRRLIRVAEADPIVLGVHPSISLDSESSCLDVDVRDLPAYVSRDVDARVRAAVARGGFVLLVGDSTAGKSRTGYEAVRALRADHTILVPATRFAVPGAVQWALEHPRSVLWLDDLEKFFGTGGGLSWQHAAVLSRSGGGLLTLATMRAEERAQLLAGSSDNPLDGAMVDQARAVLRLADTIRLERRFSAEERWRATTPAKRDRRIAAALAHTDRYGLAEYLSAGPLVWEKWQDGWAPGQHPRGAALVAAAVDCRRAGFTGHVSREMLARLHESYLDARGGSRLDPEPLDVALNWTTTRVQATAALLHGDEETGYEVFDYLLDGVQRRLARSDRIPDAVLWIMLDYADLAAAVTIASLGLFYGRYKLADAAVVTASRHVADLLPDHPDRLTCQEAVASVLQARGDYPRAEAEVAVVLEARRRVLGADHPDTLNTRHRLARLAGLRGDSARAEAELAAVLEARRRVLGADHPDTLNTRYRLARLAGLRGDSARAEAELAAVLEAAQQALGPDHPATLLIRRGLAFVLALRGEHRLAEIEFESILGQERMLLGQHHPYTLNAQHELAWAAERRGDCRRAQAEYRAVLAGREQVLGPDHPATRATVNDVTRVSQYVDNEGTLAG
jgi:tetratricopeptide (TPR) repeat protein